MIKTYQLYDISIIFNNQFVSNNNKMKEQQQTADIEVNVSEMQPRKLNWTKVLFDYHICLDAEAFEKWDGNMQMASQDILEKDIPRTRCDDPQMKKESFTQALRRITTFYCKQNGVTYQQGLLQVVFPFVLLRSKQFKTKKCYAYFNAFMRKHFPKVLVQRVVEGKKQLPHAMLALSLTDILLRFHYPSLHSCLKQNQLPISLIATQELLTIFAKNLPIKFVYEIYDFFIQKNNPNYIFFMMVALIGQEELQIQEASQSGLIHKKIQGLKKLNSMDDLKKWFQLSEYIEKTTPKSFCMIAKQFCFSNRNLLSSEDLQKMLKSQDLIAGGYLPISIQQINQDIKKYVIVLLKSELTPSNYNYQTIKLDPDSMPAESQFQLTKIYVLAAHEKKLQQQTRFLIKISQKFPSHRFLMLREHLVDQKKKACAIF